MKKIPYGISDFKRLQNEGYYFVDKTKYILEVEKSNSFLMFLRPRRFGKSLLISMLESYYDILYKDEFENLFGESYIYKQKTKYANSYLVLRFDFSGIDIDDVEDSFKEYVLDILKSFIKRYNLELELHTNPLILLNKIIENLKENSLELYLLIDEYDNFSNKILLNSKDDYNSVISNKSSVFKQFFTILKAGTAGTDAPVKRMFITGVTPMTMYDVTSGFNIGSNISLKKEYNSIVGITEDELKDMFTYYDIPKKYLSLCREWYNNYSFSIKSQEKIFNTDMILYFIDNYIQDGDLPDELIDINVRSDYSTLRDIIYTDNKLNGNFETLNTLIAGESVSVDRLVQDFSGLNLTKDENFKSLLFYLGLVTFGESSLRLKLKIPNETIKRIDIDFLKDSLELENIFSLKTSTLSTLFEKFALAGDLAIFEFLAKEIKNASSLRDYIQSELSIKAMYLAYLSFSPYYIVKSELELNKGFADIFIKPFNNYVDYLGLVELKYIPRIQKCDRVKIENLVKQAKIQLEQYEQDNLVIEYLNEGKKLKKVILIFCGWELVEMVDV